MVSSQIKFMASTRFTLIGMLLLAIGASLSYDNPISTPVWVLVVPLFLLALNLVLAMSRNKAIRSSRGLLLFHLGLLGIVVLAAVGRLTHYEAHIELVDGTLFSREDAFNERQGLWHRGALDKLRFIQRGYTVDYRPGLKRGLTHNAIQLADADNQWQPVIIGDDRPLIYEGYRIYTTSNKGFAPLLTWQPDAGESVTGTVNMPSYPLQSFRQSNEWTPPGGQTIKFWLQLDTGLDEAAAWVLDPSQATGTLVINEQGRRMEIQPGQAVSLVGGTLRYEQLLSWMGFKIFYDPTLPWLFVSAMLGIFGMAYHYWQKFSAEPLLVPDSQAVDNSTVSSGKMA